MQPAVPNSRSLATLAVRWLSATIPGALIVATVVLPPILLMLIAAVKFRDILASSWLMFPLIAFHGILALLGGWMITALWMTAGVGTVLVLAWLRRRLTGWSLSPAATLWLGWAVGLLLLVYKWHTGF